MNDNINFPTMNSRRRKIQLISRVFRVLCALILGVLLVLTGITVFTPLPPPAAAGSMWNPSSKGEPRVQPETSGNLPVVPTRVVSYRIGGSIFHLDVHDRFKPGFEWLIKPILFAQLGFLCLGIWILYRLFGLYEKGVVFASENVRYLKYVGLWLIAAAVLSNGFALSKTIWSATPMVDLRVDEVFFGGVLVLLISCIMDEGRKLQEEQQLTV